MRTNDVLLDGFEEILTLQRYLYMSEDHFITIENRIGVKLEIRMRENLEYACKNSNFPEFPESNWSDRMTNATMLDIIAQLKTVPAVEYPYAFRSRWDEIKYITSAIIGQNKLKRGR